MDSLSIEIAGIGVRLDTDYGELYKDLKIRYGEFTPANSHQATIRIHTDNPVNSPGFMNPSVEFEGSRVVFDNAGYEGYFDHQSGYGELLVASNHCQEGVEYFLRVVYAVLAFESGGILYHGAGIVRGGQAYVFYGHSGSGKTTVSRLSQHELVLNDDLLLLLPQTESWQVYATPFWNPSQIRPHRQNAPLKCLFHLVQDKRVFLQQLSFGQTLAHMVSCVPVITSDPLRTGEVLSRCSSLLALVPSYDLHFLPDNSFWQVIEKSGLV